MKIKQFLKLIFSEFNSNNITKTANSINSVLQDFGKNMQEIQNDFAEDIERSNHRRKKRESKDKDNLSKIWGKSQ